MTEWDWAKLAFQIGTYALSSAVGLGVGLWRAGRKSAESEQAVKDDYTAKIHALREETRTHMATHASKVEDGSDLLVSQFKESFEGLRRQHDDHKLDIEKRFMLKDDFKDFRDEYRDDMRDLKASIASIQRKQ